MILPMAGGTIYYEVHGDGPLLVLVPGAPGTAEIFRPLADRLAEQYAVVLYDRRGFSRSTLDGQPAPDRLAEDANDIAALIEHIEPGGRAAIFGSSSGAVVATEVLTRHPDKVRAVVPYEPAAITLLPDYAEWECFIGELYALYEHDGPSAALQRFRKTMFCETDQQLMARASATDDPDVRANTRFWFEHEIRQYTAARQDLTALRAHVDKVVPAAGAASRGYPAYQVSVQLAAHLEVPLVELPGGHAGFVVDADAFARQLHEVLTPH